MCGIAGVLDLAGKPVDPELPGRMIGAIAHRGPDATDVYVDRHVGLGHARLSIIDVSGGAQPMSIADGSLWITFNGEIFNYVELRDELLKKGHRFATRSDTEVILHLYQEEGERCVERLNGQWAFAIWDAKRQKLFLSRDRLGVRPLFYTESGGRFVFASEIKALLECPGVDAELDWQGLDEIFTFWCTLPGRTVFQNVSQLPPGHSLVVHDDGRTTIQEYWKLELTPADDDDGDGRHEDRLRDELLALLVDATRIRLRSDVPVGTYLSGGLDSTLVTALVKQAVGDNLRSFSVRFDDVEFDESPYQDESIAFLQTDHSSVRCSYEDIGGVFSDVVWHTEQPILRTAPAPLFLLSRHVRNSGFKVVVTGEGADEVLGGYDIFKETKIRQFWASRPDSAWRPLLLKRLYPYMDGIQRQSPAYLKKFFQIAPEDVASPFFSHLPRWRLTAKLKAFLSEDARAETGRYDSLAALEGALPASFRSLRPFSQAEYLEASLLLPGYILSSQGDRMAMAHAVEGRYPFLDYRVVQFASKLSTRMKMKVLDQKHLLKRAAEGLIPESVRQRFKQPYRAPDGSSFFGAKSSYVDDLLSPSQIRRDGVFEAQAVERLISKFRRGGQTSVSDNMALVGIVSTQLLIHRFMNRRIGTPAGQHLPQII
jgi:asparagine synthase (glutamine-hydrolysing)